MRSFNSQHINSKLKELTAPVFHMEMNRMFSTVLQHTANIPSAILPRRK